MEAATIPSGARVRIIAQRRAVLARLVGGNLKIKYEGSTLGYLWSVLEPLLLTAVYFFVFSIIGRFRTEAYPLFLISGLLPWQWVTHTVNQGTKALTDNAKLITKVHLPREIFPLSVVAAKGFEFVLSLVVLAIFAGVYRRTPSAFLAAMPLAFALQLMLLTGVTLGLSAVNTLLRDVERVIQPVLRAVFYLSPILYPLAVIMDADIGRAAKIAYRLNPMVGILELYHAVWYPERFAGWENVAVSGAGVLLIFAVGWMLFVRLERACLKEL